MHRSGAGEGTPGSEQETTQQNGPDYTVESHADLRAGSPATYKQYSPDQTPGRQSIDPDQETVRHSLDRQPHRLEISLDGKLAI